KQLGIPPDEDLGHHRECSYRELKSILLQYFPEPEWSVKIICLIPRMTVSAVRWVGNLLVYFGGWVLWRPLFASASQDHYAIIQRNKGARYGTVRSFAVDKKPTACV